MLQVMGLALLVVVGAVAPAEASETSQTKAGIASAVPGGAASATQARPAGAERSATVRLTGDLAMARQPLRGRGFGTQWQVVDRTTGLATLASERRQRQGWLVLPWLSQDRSGLALPVTERFALGVGYRHIRAEDLWREFADTGSMDYDSHNFVLRAHWSF